MLRYLFVSLIFIVSFSLFGLLNSVEAAVIKTCPDGQFYSIKDDVCMNLLIPEYGFQGFDLPSDFRGEVNVGCSASDFKSEAQSGKVKITFSNSCSSPLDVGSGFEIGDYTIIEGPGRDKVTIRGGNGNSGGASGLFPLAGAKNIIVRKVTLDGKGSANRAFHMSGHRTF